MSGGSPGGRQSNKAFCIGFDEDEEYETSFINKSSSQPQDPLESLLRNNEEQVPLILPRPRDGSDGTSSEDNDVEGGILITPDEINASYLIVDVLTAKTHGLWKQVSRFGRYEVDTSGYDNMFGKPHVPSLPMKYFKNLMELTKKGVLLPNVTYEGVEAFQKLIDKEVKDLEFPNLGKTIIDMISERVDYLAKHEEKERKKKQHASSPSFHVGTHVAPMEPSMARCLASAPYGLSNADRETVVTPKPELPKSISYFQRISNLFRGPAPIDSHPLGPAYKDAQEVSMVVAGPVEGVEKCRLVAVRFAEAVSIEWFPKIPKVREIFFIVGPPHHDDDMYLNMGRALASIAANPTATRAFEQLKSRRSLTETVEQVISRGLFIPSGQIENKVLISPELICKQLNDEVKDMKKDFKDTKDTKKVHAKDEDVEKNSGRETERIKGFFRGVRNDISNRLEVYKDDWKVGLTWKIIPIAFYMFCVTVVPTLTFGAIMGHGTGGLLDVQEALMSQALAGFIWIVTACQPLLVVSPTGPFLVFEKALYDFCENKNLEFMEVRFYTGITVFILTVVCSAFNAAYYVNFVTLFTEDIFCGLISCIFFLESYVFLRDQYRINPLRNMDYYAEYAMNCTGIPPEDCQYSHPNSFLLQLGMFATSMFLFNYLRNLSGSFLFKRTMRNLCSNFGGIVPVILFSFLYYFFWRHIPIAMVHIPETIGEGRGDYGYLIIPKQLPSFTTAGIALFAAIPIFVLIFLETEIPEQMASRKCKKPCGIHWDLIVVGFICLVCALMGLPFMCPAAVQSLAHIDAVTEYNPCKQAELKSVKKIREQRVSGLLLYIMIGLYAIFGYLFPIPTASIMGIFSYIGIRNLESSYILLRIVMMFTARKHRARFGILNDIPSGSCHVYTLIEIFFLIVLLLIKLDQFGGLAFPLSILALAYIRHKVLPLVFEEPHLDVLDTEFLHINPNENDEEPEDFYAKSRIPV